MGKEANLAGSARIGRRTLRRGALTALLGLSFTAAVALAATGDLTQKAGTAGCVSETGTGGLCVDGVGLDLPNAVAASPDGSNVYSAAGNSDAVAVFDRAADGTVTQKAGTAGCVSETGTGGLCVDGVALDSPNAIALSPDGSSLYVASSTSDAVAVFDRAADGTLTQKAGTAGCVSETGTGGLCADGVALAFSNAIAISPDGSTVYAASGGASNAVAVFDRAANGALTQKAGTAGCVSETGTGGLCADGVALSFPASVRVSADGSNAYVASMISDAVAVFDRAADGTLTQRAGTAGCVSETGTGGLCVDGEALNGARSVTTSPDGVSLYAASGSSDAVAIFDREPEPPSCQDLDVSTANGTPISVPLECTGVGALVFQVISAPANGSISDLDSTAGTLTYTPDPGFSGTDTFAYGASNGGGDSDPATVTIEVSAPPSSCAQVKLGVSNFKPSRPFGTGPKALGARFRLRATPQAQVDLTIRLRYGHSGSTQTVALPSRRLAVKPERRIRLILPRGLRGIVTANQRATLMLGARARPLDSAGCPRQSQRTLKLKTRLKYVGLR